jgi:hypothetical protein
MDYGQSLQVPQQMPTNFSSAQSITSNPLLNYGQTPLTMAGGGITRLNYGLGSMFRGASSSVAQPVEGGSTSSGGGFGMGLINKLIQQNPQMFKNVNSGSSLENRYRNLISGNFIDENKNGIDDRQEAAYGGRIGYQEGGMDQMQDPMMQQQMQQPPLEGIMNAMPQEAGGAQQGLSQEKGTMSLAVIIKLLMDQGIDPETAKQLAMQILQAFAQGGESGVEEFANQLEQQEQAQAMASGGIAGYGYRQGYGFGSFVKGIVGGAASAVKGVANVVKSVAKSPIGKLALTAAAVYFGGPMLASSFGISGAAGAAWAGGLANSALQIASGQKFNIGEALLAAGSGYISGGGLSSGAQGTLNAGGAGIPGADIGNYSSLNSGVTNAYGIPTSSINSIPTSAIDTYGSSSALESYGSQGMPTVGPVTEAAQAYTNPTIMDRFSQAGDYLTSTGTNLMEDPIGTIGRGAQNVLQFAKDNPLTTAAGAFGLGTQFRAPLVGEDPNEYNKLKAEHDAKVGQYITQYGGKANVYSPGNYGLYARENAVDPFANMPSYRRAANGGRIGYEYGSMPMGEPRTNPEGIMELDYRRKGGFVPPIGIKEKADDIPAMLSNNEFVFTANAVRNAGRGDVNKGAKRMYGLMKQLEAGGIA